MPDDVEPVILDDPGRLRALTHPLRRRILHRLRVHGPATSTTIGAVLAESTGTTSYHLRQLERHGFIEEIPERSTGRERWWRVADQVRDRRLPDPATLPAEDRPVVEELRRLSHAEDVALVRDLPEAAARDGDWVRVARGFTYLTPQALTELFEAYLRLVREHGSRREDAPPGARPVHLRWFTRPADEAEG